MIRVPFISCALVLAVAACSGTDPVDGKAASAASLPDINLPAPGGIGEPHGVTTPAKAERAPVARIPAALEGRCGLAPRDCMSSRAEAKSLLIVTPGTLRFHQSRVVPAADVESDGTSISEGRSWTRYEALKRDGQRLTRTETKPTASFSYAKYN